jgi:hypothetical protein
VFFRCRVSKARSRMSAKKLIVLAIFAAGIGGAAWYYWKKSQELPLKVGDGWLNVQNKMMRTITRIYPNESGQIKMDVTPTGTWVRVNFADKTIVTNANERGIIINDALDVDWGNNYLWKMQRAA